MLVLTRKKGESVIVCDELVITVLKVKKDKVVLGFKAPQEIEVWREEVLARHRALGDLVAAEDPPPPDGDGDVEVVVAAVGE